VDISVVKEQVVGDLAKPQPGFFIFGHYRLIALIAACHYERPARGTVKEEKVKRRIGQKDAQPFIFGRNT
jgi:hypothetical protein